VCSNMDSRLSVIICTHNPEVDYLNQVLESLANQTLPSELWECFIIDNASNPAIVDLGGLSIPGFCRVICEPEVGLTAARICGIQASREDFLVFVDDDNVLEDCYLERVQDLRLEFPNVAVWSGQIEPIFSSTPDDFTKNYWSFLALRMVDAERHSNKHKDAPLPHGAGMSFSREVAVHYFHGVSNNPIRKLLGRRGSSLLASEDTDIGLTACDMGLGVGLSPRLRLKHLIPNRRLELVYLNRLVEAISYSNHLLYLARGLEKTSRLQVIQARCLYFVKSLRFIESSPHYRYIRRGRLRAKEDFISYLTTGIIRL
jgi:glycosyltransferase involved in cell wall biosynthesis